MEKPKKKRKMKKVKTMYNPDITKAKMKRVAQDMERTEFLCQQLITEMTEFDKEPLDVNGMPVHKPKYWKDKHDKDELFCVFKDLRLEKAYEGEDRSWIVNRILLYHIQNRKVYFLIKWMEWDMEYATWEPLSNLPECIELVVFFLVSLIRLQHKRSSRPQL